MSEAGPRTAGEMLARGRAFLERKGLEAARLEAELLVAHALGLDRLRLFMQLDRPLAAGELEAARALFVRRARREPVAYITGTREFYGRPFSVGPGVLIPRPETELLVDLVRQRVRELGEVAVALRIADMGTGSGCIASTIALELPGAQVWAVDVSSAALAFARANADALGANVTWVEGDGPAALQDGAPFDFFVSNPPYVDRSERADLPADVRDFEPEIALFPPGERDHWIARLLDEGVPLLAPHGVLLFELGHTQGPAALRAASERGLAARLHRDLAGLDRVLEAARPAP